MDEITKLKIRNAELEAALATSQTALEEARKDIQKREQELESLQQFDRELTRSDDLDFVLNHVLTWTKLRTNADYGVVARWDDERGLLEVLLASGIPLAKDYQRGDELTLPPAMLPELHQDGHSQGLFLDDSQTFLVAELRHVDGQLVGVLVLQRHSGFKFSPNDQQFARLIANRLTISIHMSTLLQRVRDLNQHRSQLFRMLSHDLRQPLTVLMGYLQLIEYSLKMGKLDGLQTYITHVISGAKDLNDLLEEVLLMERIANKSRAQWDVISLKKVCELALEKHRPQADLSQHTLAVELPDTDAVYCQGIQIELKEAAGNLMSNAIKYTPDGGHIIVRLSEAPDERWQFEVQDNGHGIDPDRQKGLFEAFYRAQQPGTENIKGTGLGLSLVKSIIEKHHGEVYFHSTPGQGSIFGFYLPKAEAPTTD